MQFTPVPQKLSKRRESLSIKCAPRQNESHKCRLIKVIVLSDYEKDLRWEHGSTTGGTMYEKLGNGVNNINGGRAI